MKITELLKTFYKKDKLRGSYFYSIKNLNKKVTVLFRAIDITTNEIYGLCNGLDYYRVVVKQDDLIKYESLSEIPYPVLKRGDLIDSKNSHFKFHNNDIVYIKPLDCNASVWYYCQSIYNNEWYVYCSIKSERDVDDEADDFEFDKLSFEEQIPYLPCPVLVKEDDLVFVKSVEISFDLDSLDSENE